MRLISKNSKQTDELQIKEYKSKIFVLFLFVVPLVIYFWFGFQHLTQFETADEHFWISEGWLNGNLEIIPPRIPQYWEAMEKREWKNTKINDKPGISLAIISGFGQYIYGGWPDRIIQQMNFSQIFNPEKTEKVNFAFRLPILIFNGLMLIYLLTVLRRLMRSNWGSLLAVSLITLSPVLVGMSQIVNPDALLWIFVVSALSTFMLFVMKGKWWDAIFSSILLGFAFLSKYTAVVLIPFFLMIILIYLFIDYRKLEEEKRFRKKTIILSLIYPLIIAGAMGVFMLGLPAAFFDQNILFEGVKQIKKFNIIMKVLIGIDIFLFMDAALLKSWIFRKIFKHTQFLKQILPRFLYFALAALILLVLFNWGLGSNFLGIPDIASDIRDKKLFESQAWQIKLMLEIFPFIFSLTPIVLFGMLLAWLKNTIKPKEEDMFILLSTTVFLVVFYIGVLVQKLQVNIRYSVVVYAFGAIIASIGLGIPFKAFEKKRFNNLVKTFLFFVIIGISSWNLWLAKPFYFNYTNDILPKEHIINGGWGYGGYEAAQYVNAQAEDPKTLYAWTDYEGFCPFFAGRCFKGSQIKWNKGETTDKIDYYVTSRRGMMLSEQMWNNLEPMRSREPVWELEIDGRPDNFVRVYRNIKKEKTD